MRLEIGKFYAKDVVFGQKTTFADGILTINKQEAIEAANPDGNLKDLDIEIVHPGDSTRILPVKAIAEPRFRPDGRAVFPGKTGPQAIAGEGKTYAMKGVAVTSVGYWAGAGDGMIDFSGPAAEETHFAKLIHIVLTARNSDPSEDNGGSYKRNEFYRNANLLLAQYIGTALEGLEPEDWEIYDNTQEGIDPSLPRVGVTLQLSTAFGASVGLVNQLYGQNLHNIVPTMMNPQEFMDGAIAEDTLFFASFKLYTYDWQNHELLKEMFRRHGKTINFVCAFTEVNMPMADAKVRDSNRIVELAKLMNIDAMVCNNYANGHSEVNAFTTVAKLEDAGIKTVFRIMESPGHGGGQQSKVVLNPRADAIVSGGCDHVIKYLPKMDHIVGDLNSIGRDIAYQGAWLTDAEYGPSLREDGSLCIDSLIICGYDGNNGISHKTVKSY